MELKNKLIQQGRYTDCVDELIFKVANAPVKRMKIEYGENAFCIQPGVPLKTGNTLTKASSDTWNALSANQKKAVGLALLYGDQGNKGNLTGSDDEKWLATQTLVWEFVTGCREATGSYSKTSNKVYSLHFGSNYPNSGAKAAYDQIVSLLTEHNTIPRQSATCRLAATMCRKSRPMRLI